MKFKIMLSFALCALMSVVHAQMVHPGGWHTQADLTQIRTKVAAGEEPWKSAWEAYRNQYANADYRSNEGYLVTNNGSMANAGQNAHILAIKWVASGDQSYADAAIAVIDHWVENVREFDVYGPTLTLSTGAGSMAQAAEILEHAFNGESGWPKSSADAARAWMKKYVYDAYTNTGDQRSSNWGTSCVGGNMSMAIFFDDMTEFEYQRDAYLYGYQDTTDGCASLTDYIMYDSGQAFETGRDQPHVQGGIAHLTEAALCAWNQGVDLVTIENNRIRQGVEYHAKWNLGYDDLPFNTHIPNPCGIWNPGQDEGISDSERGLLSPVYYMSAKLFTLAGLDHPYTQEVLTSNGYSPEVSNTAHPGLGSLAFIPLPTDGSIEIEEPVQPVVTITSDFTPDPNKKYYIDVPVHNLRIGSTGNSEDPFTTSTNTTGADVEWKFTSNESGAWHIDRADGGSLPRLRTDATESADMQSTASDGRWESFIFSKGSANDTYFVSSSNGPEGLQRLQVNSEGDVNMVPLTYDGSWESFRFTEVEGNSGTTEVSGTAGSSRVVQITKRNAPDFAIDGGNGGENGQDVYLWSENENNQNQQWLEIDRGNGYYSYQKIGTNYAIDGGNGSATNQNVYLWDINENNQNQHWQKVDAGGGAFKLVKRNAPEFALNGGNDGENGQTVNLWSSSSTNHNLQWFITPIDGLSAKSLNVLDSEQIIMYPNPVVSTATIQGAANSTLRIYDMNGKIVLTENIVNDSEEIDLSSLATGVYYGQINGLFNTEIIKIVKQ